MKHHPGKTAWIKSVRPGEEIELRDGTIIVNIGYSRAEFKILMEKSTSTSNTQEKPGHVTKKAL
jgi:hypothetical protein